MNNKKLITVKIIWNSISFYYWNSAFSYWNSDILFFLRNLNFDDNYILNLLEKETNELRENENIWVNKLLIENLFTHIKNKFDNFDCWLDLLWEQEDNIINEDELSDIIQKIYELWVISLSIDSQDVELNLNKEKILYLIDKWFLKSINSDLFFSVNPMYWEKLSFEMNYWKIVKKILLMNYYWDYIISWESAIKLYLWDLSKQKKLEIRLLKKNSNYDFELPYWFFLKIRKTRFEKSDSLMKTRMNIHWIFFDIQDYNISLLELFFLKKEINKNHFSWIINQRIDKWKLEFIYENERIWKILFWKISDFFYENKSRLNYIDIQEIIWKRIKEWEDIFWTFINWFDFNKKNLNSLNYDWKMFLSRYQDKLFNYLSQIKRNESDFKKLSLNEILNKLEEDKVNDIYHSTTIEWYQISKDEITAIIKWEFPDWIKSEYEKKKYLESIKEYITIKNYKSAMDYVKELIQNESIIDIDQELIKTIRWKLFNSENYQNEMNYSKLQRFIRKKWWWISKHIPPQPSNIFDCMSFLENEVNKIKDWWKKAIILHCLFVDMHPFSDWNWRVWRFLMNLILSKCWIWWIIIEESKREKFFECLEKAQVEWNISDLEEFLYWIYEKQYKK